MEPIPLVFLIPKIPNFAKQREIGTFFIFNFSVPFVSCSQSWEGGNGMGMKVQSATNTNQPKKPHQKTFKKCNFTFPK